MGMMGSSSPAEASPGPQDSFYLFERFAQAMEARKATA